jgi:hypothetical protein
MKRRYANWCWWMTIAAWIGMTASYANVVAPDVLGSARVAATSAEFRVDEQGAIYAVPGAAGVNPNLHLASVPAVASDRVSKSFTIHRASRESGDFRDATGQQGPDYFVAQRRAHSCWLK